jgi:CRP-like cAMP-binding protein
MIMPEINHYFGISKLTIFVCKFQADVMDQDVSIRLNESVDLMHVSNEREILQLLAENRDISKYKKRQIVYAEGNRPSRLYYVQKGKIKTFKTNDEGKDLIIGLYKEGDFLGYVALLEGTAYKESAEAIENAELAVIPKQDFDELIDNNRQVSRKFIRLLAHNVTENENHLLGLAYNSLRKKVAEALIMLNMKYKVAINISRVNLASMAGTATESLIRTLSDFRTEKLIDIKEGCIIILNEKKLGDLVN